VVDDRDPVGQLVGLVEVLRGEEHRGAVLHDCADEFPDLVAAVRIEPRGGLVEEQQVRGEDDARGEVDPSPHAAGVGLDLAACRLGESEAVQQLFGPGLRLRAGEAEQAAEQLQVLCTGEILVDGCELPGQADAVAHRGGVANDVMAKHSRRPSVGLHQGREDADGGRLAGAVRAEHAVDGAGGYGELESIDGAGLAVGLHESRHLDGELLFSIQDSTPFRYGRLRLQAWPPALAQSMTREVTPRYL
jgi:hypothetical protein